ncbi:MAG: hypothetical protein DRR16_09165 [Candidatus Parabeggiatoa sp. nov. 3]|jgi:hypothetical protein|nr:MAG: hypothetical protein DRR00_09680 [Gammaproteobacteria bacterium]RKZ58914.1 MAG: hypothetical protein DRQ99_24670 [Gammaproteobacteria bacterium]RKZ86616.1 MAG: hypothetical protein DRR16_09165 [Gammaproteobacteria bacterium]
MANQMLLDAIDEVLSRLDLMSDEELQTKYDNHKGGLLEEYSLMLKHFSPFWKLKVLNLASDGFVY